MENTEFYESRRPGLRTYELEEQSEDVQEMSIEHNDEAGLNLHYLRSSHTLHHKTQHIKLFN